MSKFREMIRRSQIGAANNRAEILSLLRDGPKTVSELSKALGIIMKVIRDHLRRLRNEKKVRVKGYIAGKYNDTPTALYELGSDPSATEENFLFPDGKGGYTDMERVVIIRKEFEPLNIKRDPLTAALFGKAGSDD